MANRLRALIAFRMTQVPSLATTWWLRAITLAEGIRHALLVSMGTRHSYGVPKHADKTPRHIFFFLIKKEKRHSSKWAHAQNLEAWFRTGVVWPLTSGTSYHRPAEVSLFSSAPGGQLRFRVWAEVDCIFWWEQTLKNYTKLEIQRERKKSQSMYRSILLTLPPSQIRDKGLTADHILLEVQSGPRWFWAWRSCLSFRVFGDCSGWAQSSATPLGQCGDQAFVALTRFVSCEHASSIQVLVTLSCLFVWDVSFPRVEISLGPGHP